MRQLALLLAAVMLLSVTALAAGDNDKATITDELTGATATFDTSNSDIINVTFTSPDLNEGGQYLILMIKGTSVGSNYPTITEDSILYIDQTAATGNIDGTATIEFDVYPSSIQDSVILITGVDGGPLVAAIVNAKYILGDVNGDGYIDATDALFVLRHAARIQGAELTGSVLSAADVNNDTYVDATDALFILRLRAGLIEKLPAEN